jgi:hypothetical protein
MYICMHLRLAIVLTIQPVLFTFGIQDCVHHRPVPGEYEHSSSKIRDPSDGPQKTELRFSRKRL